MPDMVTNQYEPDRVSPPGETLLESIEALGMTQAELSDRLGRPKKTVNEIVHGKAAITPETALQLESVLGIPADFWMNREARYREFLARQEEEHALAAGVEWLRCFPLSAMIQYGWIEKKASRTSQVRELLRFFGVASPESWQDTWRAAEVAFRRSAKVDGDRHAIAAWLRRGEIDGQAVQCEAFTSHRFEEALEEARPLTREQPQVFQPGLTRLFAAAGVAVAWVRELPKVPISGATRWLGPEKALIQVSLRYTSDDQLWFSLFHEAGHVLKHPRKLVFLEGGTRKTDEEREADEFAAQKLIPGAEYSAFVECGRFTHAAIGDFAARVRMAPGIVVGRLQYDKHLLYSQCNDLKRRLQWVER